MSSTAMQSQGKFFFTKSHSRTLPEALPEMLPEAFPKTPTGIEQETEKLFIKAVRIDGAELNLALLRKSGANTVWLERPTPQAIDRILSMGFRVVLDLGFRDFLNAKLARDKAAEKQWRLVVKECLEHSAKLTDVVAIDLGSGHALAPIKFFGRRRWQSIVRKALIEVRKASSGKLLTCTVALHREGSRYTFGQGLAVADIGTTFRHLFDWPIDFVSAEVADDDLTNLRDSLARLQVLCYDVPLVVHVRPWDSRLHSALIQATSLDAQIRLSFNAGCAGMALTRWQDGADVCGLIDTNGKPKLALDTSARAFAETPFSPTQLWPSMSIVICAFNSGETLEDCLAGCAALNYSDFEVIVVIDKCTDATEAIAARWSSHPRFQMITQPLNRGLSFARNVGAQHATGEIVAYLDADAFPDRDWLRYLAMKFLQTKFAVIGGPNLNPLKANEVSDCVDRTPGNPGLVMLDDEACDHVAGCNLAIRREFLNSIGGFTDAFHAGGDDVTLCWRTILYGGALGYAPGAMVWHYRRWTVIHFLKQQRTYGKGETALEKDWPERYNSLGHSVPPDRLPGWKRTQPLRFGGMYQPFSSSAFFLVNFAQLPEFFLLNLIFLALAASAVIWPGLIVFVYLSVLSNLLWVIPAVIAAKRAPLRKPTLRLRAITMFLFLAQPLARARGRWGTGMTPWRDRLPLSSVSTNHRADPVSTVVSFARKFFAAPLLLPIESGVGVNPHDVQRTNLIEESKVASAVTKLRLKQIPVYRGGSKDDWDIQVEGGAFAGARAIYSVGVRASWSLRPYTSRITKSLALALICLVGLSLYASAWPIAILALISLAWVNLKMSRQGLAALEELRLTLSAPEIVAKSELLWKRFQPPSYLFVDLVPPEDRARTNYAVAGEGQLIVQRGHLDQ